VDELSLQQRYEMTQQGYEVRVAVTERNNDRHVIPAANQCSPLKCVFAIQFDDKLDN